MNSELYYENKTTTSRNIGAMDSWSISKAQKDYILKLEQENKQLKEELELEKRCQNRFFRINNKSYDGRIVLEQLKQRDEAIDEISKILNKHRFEENDDYYDYSEQGICITSWDDDYDRLNELLQKYKGDNE